jgi:nucleoside-triphosphatase THEP1
MPKTRILILTGAPGVGKNILLMRTVELLKEQDLALGGVVSL